MAVDLSGLTREQKVALLEMLKSEAAQEQKAKYLKAAQDEMMGERSSLDNALAGFGKAFYDTARGAGQLVGMGPSRGEMDQIKALESPLMDTKAGMAGNLLGNVAISMGPLGAAKVASMAPRAAAVINAIPGANTVIGGAALGGAMGATRPVGTDDSRLVNTAMGAGAGALVPAAVTAYRTVGAAADPLLGQAGMDRVTGRMLARFASDPESAAAKLLASKAEIPGVRLPASEATLDPGLATLERSLATFPGSRMQQIYADRLAENNATRQQFLRALSGTADDVSNLQKAASSAYDQGINAIGRIEADVNSPRAVQLIDRLLTSPKAEGAGFVEELTKLRAKFLEPYPAAERLSDAARIVRDAIDSVGTRRISSADFAQLEEARRAIISALRRSSKADPNQLAQEAMDVLSGLAPRNRVAASAVDDAYKLLAADNTAFKRDPARLAEIYKDINKTLRDGAEKLSPDVKQALNAVKRSLANSIDRATGYGGTSFKTVNRQYAAAKDEIGQMQVLQDIAKRSSGPPVGSSIDDATGSLVYGSDRLYPTKFMQATRPESQAEVVKRVTGRRGDFSMLSDTRRQGIEDLRRSVQRGLEASQAGKPQGSPTQQFLYAQNLLSEILGPIGLPTTLADKIIGGAMSAPVVGSVLSGANRLAGRKMAEHASDVLLNNPQRAGLLMQQAMQAQQRALNPGVSRLLPPTLSGIAGGMFGVFPRIDEQPVPYGARW